MFEHIGSAGSQRNQPTETQTVFVCVVRLALSFKDRIPMSFQTFPISPTKRRSRHGEIERIAGSRNFDRDYRIPDPSPSPGRTVTVTESQIKVPLI